jgi:hypothetical protein
MVLDAGPCSVEHGLTAGPLGQFLANFGATLGLSWLVLRHRVVRASRHVVDGCSQLSNQSWKMQLEEASMADQERRPASRRTDEQADGSESLPESGMGGTSDAGTAADDAAEAAALHRGLSDDRTQRSVQTPGAGTSADEGTRGFSGGAISPEEQRPTAFNLDEPNEGDSAERRED